MRALCHIVLLWPPNAVLLAVGARRRWPGSWLVWAATVTPEEALGYVYALKANMRRKKA